MRVMMTVHLERLEVCPKARKVCTVSNVRLRSLEMNKLCAIVVVMVLGAGGLWAAPWFADVMVDVGLEGDAAASWADYDDDGWMYV